MFSLLCFCLIVSFSPQSPGSHYYLSLCSFVDESQRIANREIRGTSEPDPRGPKTHWHRQQIATNCVECYATARPQLSRSVSSLPPPLKVGLLRIGLSLTVWFRAARMELSNLLSSRSLLCLFCRVHPFMHFFVFVSL